MQRPLDVLGSSQDKRVIVKMKSGESIAGILKAFDQHINIWLDDAEVQGNGENLKLGRVLLRGDNIIFVSPSK
ncbi:MAG: RNA-binding protein [Candidatus Aenigmarchaeota archaeon]|nr:RNA-binding protein [Candidatus Aenigmarchaeota archaeon]